MCTTRLFFIVLNLYIIVLYGNSLLRVMTIVGEARNFSSALLHKLGTNTSQESGFRWTSVVKNLPISKMIKFTLCCVHDLHKNVQHLSSRTKTGQIMPQVAHY